VRDRLPSPERTSNNVCRVTPDEPSTSNNVRRSALAVIPIEETFLAGIHDQIVQHDDGRLTCTMVVGNHLLQPMGIVHGGVYASIAETLASMGSALAVGIDSGMAVMGQSNNTTFLRSVRDGTIRATAFARHKGRTTMVWQIDMVDDDDRLCATSQVTIAVRPRRPAQR
jgi:1,4-dihydroxy-2-naphthoyl-CoA hydrolase